MTLMHLKRNRRGITFAEVLLVMAILAVIAMVAVPNLIQIRKQLKQRELDDKAEIIYHAVQNRLLELRAAGTEELYADVGQELADGQNPIDMSGAASSGEEEGESGGEGSSEEKRKLRFFTNNEMSGPVAQIMSEDVLSAELLAAGWVVEFEPNIGGIPAVYAVFYSKDTSIGNKYQSHWEDYDYLRKSANERIEGYNSVPGVTVGYYGGEITFSSSSSEKVNLTPTIDVYNGEKLIVTLSGVRLNDSLQPRYTLILEDTETGYISTEVFTTSKVDRQDGIALKKTGNKYYTVSLTLDDLSSPDTRFGAIYNGPLKKHGTELKPGNPIKLTFKIEYLDPSGTGVAFYSTCDKKPVINGLFANETTIDENSRLQAKIACGRHLQNLDERAGATEYIIEAQQTASIELGEGTKWSEYYTEAYFNRDASFVNGTWEPWESYGSEEKAARFLPIKNKKLESYDGNYQEIDHLCVNESDNAGLFAELSSDMTVSNVRLTGTRVKATGANGTAGALVGSASGGYITDCAVYLTENDVSNARGIISDKGINPVWISGIQAGGLVGETTGAVEIKRSLASTVVKGSICAGGLVGDGADAKLYSSYSDSYLFSDTGTGGLVGKGAANTVSYCYAAGFQTLSVNDDNTPKSGTTAAGLVNGSVTTIDHSYSVCDLKNSGAETLYAAVRSGSATRVYYWSQNELAQPSIYQQNPTNILAISNKSAELCNDLNKEPNGSYSDQFLGVSSSPSTLAYGFDEVGRITAYSYPYLNLRKSSGDAMFYQHYGDWLYSLEEGGLVYYEKYKNGRTVSYGISGAGAIDSIVKTGNVVGDGYGVVYSDLYVQTRNLQSIIDSTKIYINNGNHKNDSDYLEFNVPFRTNKGNLVKYRVEDKNGAVYWVFPFVDGIVNAEPTNSNEFYTAMRIVPEGMKVNAVDTYFFNPHFAKGVHQVKHEVFSNETVDQEKDLTKARIYIRTPRHLHDLSQYYDKYFRSALGNGNNQVTFTQERNISFSAYEWPEFAGISQVQSQEPIGRAENTSFCDTYQGGCFYITDVSFVSEDGMYVGMIGYNKGTVKNTVLATEYVPKATKHYFVQRETNMGENEVVSMGVLVGKNDGTVDNCAVAGYYVCGQDEGKTEVTLHAYRGSTLYAGGLVGMNEGTIKNSSANCPAIRLSSTDAYVDLGGFVGRNEGQITNCYALGHLEVAYASGGNVCVSGFAGSNEGSVSASYCAVSSITSGESATSYGFSTDGGSVTGDCYFLDKGTYRYAGSLHAYSVKSTTTGKAKSFEELKRLRAGATASSSNCYFNKNVQNKTGYPYRAVVKNIAGTLVHYGDWQEAPELGMVGVFYWEHEEGGTNSGYHFSYLGTVIQNGEKEVADSTLCTAHDDGGVITDFGYGYYVSNSAVSQLTDITSINLSFDQHNYNTDVSRELQLQMQSHKFYPFTTRGPHEDKPEGKDDSICLTGDGAITAGTLTLTFNGKSYQYEIAPFYANAMRRVFDEGSNKQVKLITTDGAESDLTKSPGTADNVFEVRSVRQLQFINWNSTEKNCSTLVDGNNYMQFPYLQYATVIVKGTQSRNEANAKRPEQYWNQTHDLHGGAGTQDEEANAQNGGEGAQNGGEGAQNGENSAFTFTPIAGLKTSTTDNSYDINLYTWFGGHYDGQSYKIQNLNIESPSFSVGLFGATAGAEIKNVILFGNGSTYVKRATVDDEWKNKTGAYNIGGLIGVAYDYCDKGVALGSFQISNCSIAGYQIIDESTNKQGAGTANMGGLIGMANVAMERCSAVVDIHVACTHEKGHAIYGSFIRVGGLAGVALHAITDCYTGGSITVDREKSLFENPKPQKDSDTIPTPPAEKSIAVKRDKNSFNIFCAGIVCGTYGTNFQNFRDTSGGQPSGRATISNCYTYLQLPKVEGNIRAVSLIASQGDRYNRDSYITMNQCYYYKDVADRVQFDANPGYYFDSAEVREGKNNGHDITEADFALMLKGDLTPLYYTMHRQITGGGISPTGTPVEVTYEDLCRMETDPTDNTLISMKERLANGRGDSPWGWVTTEEGVQDNKAKIPGKYSFSDRPAQQGMDYPFPTILTQKDLTYSTADETINVNVHYGAWPIDGDYWEHGESKMYLMKDMKDSGYAEKTFKLLLKDSPEENEDRGIVFSRQGIVEKRSIEYVADGNYYNVTLRALKLGNLTVTDSKSGASFYLEVRSDLTLSAESQNMKNGRLLLFQNEDTTLNLKAKYGEIDLSTQGTWTCMAMQDADSSKVEIKDPTDPSGSIQTMKGGDTQGDLSIRAIFQYPYGGGANGVGAEMITASLPISAKSLGDIGLASSKEDTTTYSLVSRGPENVDAVEKTVGRQPKLAGPQLYLFGTAADDDLKTLEVTADPPQDGYLVDVPDEVGIDKDSKDYLCRPVYVTYNGSGSPQQVQVVLKVVDSWSGATYQFSRIVEADRIGKYKITFDPNGADGGYMPAASIATESYTLPECRLTKTGYTFEGWLVDGVLKNPDDTIESANNPTVVAQWKQNTVTVTYHSGSESKTYGDVQAGVYTLLAYDSVFSELATDSDHEFLGWSVGDSLQTYDAGDSIELEGNVDIYALLRGIAYTVYFDPNGGQGEVKQKTVHINDSVELPSAEKYATEYEVNPPEDGKKLIGWSSNPEATEPEFYPGEKVLNLSTVPNSKVRLYAIWGNAIELTLSAASAEGYTRTIPVGKLTEATIYNQVVTVPTKTNWTLDGWYTSTDPATATKILDSEGKLAYDGSSDLPDGWSGCTYESNELTLADGEYVLYARWKYEDKDRTLTPDGTVYQPRGTKFYRDWTINFDEEYLDVYMDLSGCDRYSKCMVLSVGTEDIDHWEQNVTNTIHINYPRNGPIIRFNEMLSISKPKDINLGTQRIIRIQFRKEGIFIDGAALDWNNTNYSKIINALVEGNTIRVGSTQGTGRSFATYFAFRVARDDTFD